MEITENEDRTKEDKTKAKDRRGLTSTNNRHRLYPAPERKSTKNKTLIGLSTQRAEAKKRFLDIASTCNTLVNNNGVWRKVKVKEPKLAIDKHVPSLIRTLSAAVYYS